MWHSLARWDIDSCPITRTLTINGLDYMHGTTMTISCHLYFFACLDSTSVDFETTCVKFEYYYRGRPY